MNECVRACASIGVCLFCCWCYCCCFSCVRACCMFFGDLILLLLLFGYYYDVKFCTRLEILVFFCYVRCELCVKIRTICRFYYYYYYLNHINYCWFLLLLDFNLFVQKLNHTFNHHLCACVCICWYFI